MDENYLDYSGHQTPHSSSPRAMRRPLNRLWNLTSAVLTGVAFTLIWLLWIVLPWLVHKVARFDPLGGEHDWIRRARRPQHPSRPWIHDSGLTRRHRPGIRRKAAVVGAIAFVCLLMVPQVRETLVGVEDRSDDVRPPFRLHTDQAGRPPGLVIRDGVDENLKAKPGDPHGISAAMEGSSWFTDDNYYNTAQGWALRPANAWRPVNPYRLLDFRSRYLNVVDGSRASWQPPECGCRRLRVWMYGGSTTYGLNQRDGHTIASEIARVADEHGMSIDISNRGSLGHLHWMEAERFAWDLTIEKPPDMAIFYDGVNESWAASTLNTVGAGDTKPMRDPTTFDLWRDTGRSSGGLPKGPPGSALIGQAEDVDIPPGALERTMVERYNRSRTLSRTAAEAHGVEVRYIWQPTRLSRPLVESEPHDEGPRENSSRASEQYVRTLLADDVIDVSDALRGTDEPLFTDDVHHNEAAARLIAESIYERVGDDLAQLAQPKNAP